MNNKSILVYPKSARAFLGVGTTKFYDLRKDPKFPKAKFMGGKRPMYLLKELEDWANNLD